MPRRFTKLSLVALPAALALGAGPATSDAALANNRPAQATTTVSPAGPAHAALAPASRQQAGAQSRHCPSNALLVPKCGVMFGAYVKPEGGQSSEGAFTSLQQRTGSHLRVLHFYHGGTQLFPSSWEISQSKKGHRLLLNWKPETGHTWAQVASGASDSYIDREAAYLRQHYAAKKFFLVIHHEPEDEVRETSGSGYTAADYAAMFRHVENRLRSDGVHNAVYVMCYMGAEVHAVKPWYPDLWPGNAYVDWIGFDKYSAPPMTPTNGDFKKLVNRHYGNGQVFRGAYRWAHAHHPRKPVMLAEWGASESPVDPGWKGRMFGSVTRGLRSMPNLKLISYFDSPGDKGDDKSVDTSASSMNAWRHLAAKPMFHRRR
jgi:Glycosyl hydrolase family 26